MNVKSILVLVLTVGWFAVCNWWYCCKLRHACAGCAPTTEIVDPTVAERPSDPLVFEPSKSVALTNDAFAKLKGGIVAKETEDNLLEITGYYYPDEENSGEFDNLGLARADAIRKLFVPEIAEERIRLKASQRSGSVEDKGAYFTAADFKWIKQETKTSEVIQLADRAIILFPFASIQKEADPSIDAYLEKLAERVKQTGESISITGHTDNKGEEAANQKLGLARARVIRDYLVNKGVDQKLISITSKGETEPVASNDTEGGRHQNRRTEVRIIKKAE